MTRAAAERLRRLVDAHREEIREAARRNKASNVRLFGSVARGDASEESDVDILVTFGPHASLFDVARLELDLEALLGVHVDVVEERALHRLIRDEVLNEAVPV